MTRNAHDLLPIPCLYCSRRFADLAGAHEHMERKHGHNYVKPGLPDDPEERRQLRRIRAYDHERRAQLKREKVDGAVC